MIVFYPNGEKTPLNNYNDYHIRHTADGFDELHFSVPTSDPQYPLLLEEMPVEAAGNNWLIKKIYDDDIACELNLDELKATGTRAFDSGSVTLQTLLSSVLPNGWTATGAAQSTIRRTIRMDFATPLDILSAAMEIYGVCMQFDVPNRSITVVVPSLQPVSGEYITDELNLRKLSYQGETSDFCTRLYAYGADGLSIADAIVNGSRYGLPYVDNHEYSDKIIVGYWEDSRYDVAENLYDDAVARLAELARPVQSYECDAIDLAKESDEYSFLAFRVHRKITLIDRKRSLRVIHQIVEYDEYPEEPSRSVVTLSSTAPTVTSVMRSQIETVEREAQNTAVSEIARATELLTGAQGGYIVFHYDEDKKPYEMLIMDAANESDAVHVWRYNKNGWGYSANGVDGNYTLAATIDGGIIADFIKTGTLDCEDLTVTNLTASDVHLDGLFESEETVSGVVNKVVLYNGAIRIYRDNYQVASIAASALNNAQLRMMDANGIERMILQGNGAIYLYDANYKTRLIINGDGDIYAFDSNGKNAATIGGSGAHQIITYDEDGNEFTKFTGTKATIGAPINEVPRKCSALLASAGWYRAIVMNAGGNNPTHGELGELLKITIGREFGATIGESHQIDFSNQWYRQVFDNEVSHSGVQYIDQIRTTGDSTHLYIDIHYTGTNENRVSVTFDVEGVPQTTNALYAAASLQAVSASPSGETVLASYSFSDNGAVQTFKDATINGVLDVTQRRCYATLSSAGWYRVCTTRDIAGTIIEFNIGRPYGANPAEAHRVLFYVVGGGNSSFIDETSISNTLGIDKIRCTYGGGVIHFDVHYSLSTSNEVLVYFDVRGKGEQNGTTVSNGLQAVADAPSGETVLTTYEFAANTMYQSVTIPYSQFASSNGTIWGTESHVKLVWDNKKVVMTGYILLKNPAAGILGVDFSTPSGFPYDKFNGNWLIIGQAYRRSGGYMQPCDFVYGIINSSRIRFAERNMFSWHPATDYAMITIPTATYYFD